MNWFLSVSMFLGLLSGTAHAQAPTVTAHLDATAHQKSVLKFQKGLNKEFKDEKESPLAAAERKQLKSLPFYPTDYAYYVEATLVRDSTSQPFAMPTSTDRLPMYRKYGELRFVLNGQPQ